MADKSGKRSEGVTPLKQSPFAGLLKTPLPAPAPAALAAPVVEKKGPPRAVVRIERKGRRGKDVTIVEQLDLNDTLLEKWLKDLKQSLGTGGSREGTNLVLQGDHRDRVAKWLDERGVKKVTIAN